MIPKANTPDVSHEMIVIIRPSFQKICEQDICRAALFNHLLYWIAQKTKGQPEEKIRSGEVCWYGSLEEIYESINRAWSLNKVSQEVKALVESGMIGQRHNPTKGWDRKYQYFFGCEQGETLKDICEKHGIDPLKLELSHEVSRLLCLVVPSPKSNESIPQICGVDSPNMWDASPKSDECIPQICGMDSPNLVDGFPKFGGAIPKDTTKDTAKDTAKDTIQNFISDQPQSDKSKRQKRSQSRSQKTSEIQLTLQGEHILTLYDEFKGRKVVRNAQTLLAANNLGEVVSRDEDFVEVLKAIANDPFLKQKQVRTDLDFVYRKYDGFLDRVEQARGRRPPGDGPLDYNEVIVWTSEQRAEYKRQMQEEMQRALPPGMDEETFMKMKLEDRVALLEQLRGQKEVP